MAKPLTPIQEARRQELRRIRESCGLSQADMARQMQVPPGTYYQWERDLNPVPVRPHILRLARVTGLAHFDAPNGGARRGRKPPPLDSPEFQAVIRLRQEGHSFRDIAKACKIGVGTAYRWCKKLSKNTP